MEVADGSNDLFTQETRLFAVQPGLVIGGAMPGNLQTGRRVEPFYRDYIGCRSKSIEFKRHDFFFFGNAKFLPFASAEK